MKMEKSFVQGVFADITRFNVSPSNSSHPPSQPVVEGLKFDKDAPVYDMSGKKFLIILNQYKFEKTEHFKCKPTTREGTFNDVLRLKEVFHKLGFLIFVFRDFKYKEIIAYLTAIAAFDHSKTSCICVTILTHGGKGGEVYAADKPYLLKEVIAIFENQTSLTNKPKLFFVQACRGESMDAGRTVLLPIPSSSVLTTSPTGSTCRLLSSGEEMPMQHTGHTDAPSLSLWSRLLKVFGIFRQHAGNTDLGNSQSDSFLTVPTHADILVLRSTVEDHLSYRDSKGSWMIQALCDIIEKCHRVHHLLDIITLMNREVAYEKITRYCKWKPMENKKQMPETRFTLTKELRCKPTTREGTFNDVLRLKEVFHKLGFLIFVFRDFKYKEIIAYLTAIAAFDHSKTSCICVTILTHGGKGGEVYAADKPYLLKEVIAIFENQTSLTNKPKLFFVQACRGESMDAGRTVLLPIPSSSVLTTSPTGSTCRLLSSGEEMPMQHTGHTDAPSLSFWSRLLKVFGIFRPHAGNTDLGNSQSDSFLTVPTHADILVLRSTVEDHLSYRDSKGSWMIQALCDIIEKCHRVHHLLDIITLMNREVAYEKITRYCKWKPMENKKQMPETSFTFTKELRFETDV